MKKNLSFLVLICCMLLFCIPSYAHERPEHDEDLEWVLFGDRQYKKKLAKEDDRYKVVKMLEDAVYLCLDQYNGNGKKELRNLQDFGVQNIPDDIAVIDFSGNSLHRQFTHKGWDFTYPLEEGKSRDKANWPVRKEILQSTVKNIFGDKEENFFLDLWENVQLVFSEKRNEEKLNFERQLDSFCAFAYYVHVLGDQVDSDKYSEEFTSVPFTRTASKGDICIADEIERYMDTLFARQEKSEKYKKLRNDLEGIRIEAERYQSSPGGLSHPENFENYRQCERAFLDKLGEVVPDLLKKEEFFSKVFYD